MSKNKEYTEKGVREFYSLKGCHSCMDCVHCLAQMSIVDKKTQYHCDIKIGKNTILDRRFPYDNTKCEDFKEQSTER